MPFSAVYLPSIGLTQLKTIVEKRFASDAVSIEIVHCNQDFALYMGIEFYQNIADSVTHLMTGLGDWFFRAVAFPHLEDNSETYFRRFYPYRNPRLLEFKTTLLEKRAGIDDLLDQLIANYGLEDADVVGFTSMFAQNCASFAMARKLKEKKPSIMTLMGGANCEAPLGLELIKQVDQLDYVFSGPALQSFPQFIEALITNQLDACDKIAGVLSKTNVKQRETAALLNGLVLAGVYGSDLDINEQLMLDYKPFLKAFELKISSQTSKFKPILQFETSRGCWWGERSHCTFCGLNGTGMNYRSMRPELAVEYINAILKYTNHSKHLECVDNIIPKSYFKEVLPHLETPPDVDIFYEVKADLTEQEVAALANSRVLRIQPGIEALATSTLKLMRKGTSAFQNLHLLQHCVLYNVFPEWNLLVGFPGEAEEVYLKYIQDLPMLVHLPPPRGVYPIRFDRFSPYFQKAKEYGLDLRPMDFYRYVYPFSSASLTGLAYFFADTNMAALYLKSMGKWYGKLREQFEFWHNRWYGADKKLFPLLFFIDLAHSSLIYDSRSGQEMEHDVGMIGKQILERLTKATKMVDLQAEFRHLLGPDKLEQEVAHLKEKGLIFQEAERVMSLVLSRRPTMNYTSMEMR
jgi:ribosomal peptide maturation radical SAM protein 1